MVLSFFIIISIVVTYIDIKKRIIPDIIMFPSLLVLVLLKLYENSLHVEDFFAVGIVLLLFVLPIVLGMAFGGGDLRFGAFCALFLGLKPLGVFIMMSGVIHLIILFVLKRKTYAFAPSMSAAAIIAYVLGDIYL